MRFRNLISVICVISLIFGLAIPANAAKVLGNDKAYVLYDVNEDGAINIIDLVSMKKFIAGIGNKVSVPAADSDGNGLLNAFDIPYLIRTLLSDETLELNNDEFWSSEYNLTNSQGALISRKAPTEKSVTVLTNNYDDSGVTFSSSYDGGYTSVQSTNLGSNGRTSATYNGSTINNLTFNNAAVESTTDAKSVSTKAVHFGFSRNGETSTQQENNTVKLYKKTDSGITLFTPQPNTTYNITFDYKIDAINGSSPLNYWGWPTALELVYANDASGSSWTYNAANVIVDRLAYFNAITGWTTRTVTFRTGDDVKPLGIILQSPLYAYWASPQDMWLDNIILKETTQDLEQDFSGKVANTIMYEDFSDDTVGSIPQGFVRNHAFNFLWAGNNATGLNYNVGVKNDGTRNYLQYFSINGGHILTVPNADVRNYKYSVKMRLKRNGLCSGADKLNDYRMSGKIGLATDISEEVATEENANIFLIDTESGSAEIFNRKYYSADFGGIDVNKRLLGIKRDNNKPFDNSSSEEITLTAYHVDGYTYYYYEGNFVGSLKGEDKLTGNRIGIYNYGQYYGARPEILSVTVEELVDLTDTFDYSEKVYADDFSDTAIGAMPQNMTVLENEQWGWIGNNPTLITRVESGANKNVFRFGTNNRQAAILFPTFTNGDYCVNMNVKIDDANNAGYFGLLTNINGTSGGSVMTASMPINDSRGGTIQLESRVTWEHKNTKQSSVSDVLGKAINTGDDVTMTVYHIGNVSKFYINGIAVGELADYYNTSSNQVGFYSCNAEILIKDIGVYKIVPKNTTNDLKVKSAAIRFADAFGEATLGGMRITGTLDKTSDLYTDNIDGAYVYYSDIPLKMGLLIAPEDNLNGYKLNRCTNTVVDVVMDSDISQTDSILTFREGFVNMNVRKCDKTYFVRAYAEDGDGNIVYSETFKVCPSKIANIVYPSEDAEAQGMISEVYGDSGHFYQSDDYNLTFTLFSDFHYKDGCYLARVADLNTIFDRADASDSDFVIHGGDFCNDFRGSPELTNAFLNNKYGIKAYGIYGNHELESANNNMGYVTTKLTNNSDVVWGTEDGKIGDGTIGYYYYKAKGFRVICTDTNYSYNSSKGIWEHNTTNSYGAPDGNINQNALGPVQLEWLEDVLTDAANNNIPCIVVGHASFNKDYKFGYSSDAQTVMNLFDRVNNIKANTVIMSINGHYHADGPQQVVNNVLYLSVNTTINGYFGDKATAYPAGLTYTKDVYDASGNLISSGTAPLTDLDHNYLNASNFFNSPLSTTVHINNLTEIVVDSCESGWLYDVKPSSPKTEYRPEIVGGTYNLD